MGGICGWIRSGVPSAPDPGGSRSIDAMARAMAHRGAIASLPGRNEGEGPRIAADSTLLDARSLAGAWERASADGVAFASSLEGAHSLAILDGARRRLVLVRDRLGERPLCYSLHPGGVAFASEMKALVEAGLEGERAIRPEALDAFLAFTYVPAPWTILQAVHKVPAGHVVEIDLAPPGPPLATQRRYWSAPAREGLAAAPGEALGRLREALRRRLTAAGTPAAFLSGGLDSSLVVALLREEGLPGIRTLSAGFDEPDLDESAHARRVASLLGTEHVEIVVRDVDPDLVIRIVRQLDEPMADAAVLPTWLLARAASETSSVVMTGDGADALLAGDHWFRRLDRLDALERLPEAGRRVVAAAASLGGRRKGERMRHLAALASVGACERYLRLREKWTPEERLASYAEPFRSRMDPGLTARTYTGAPVRWARGESVDAALRLDSIHGLPEDLLMKVDKMGGAHGVECRSPFLDRDWVEWVSRLDVRLLLRGRTSKYLLKRAARGILPAKLVHRRKQGFRVPAGRWLKGSLRPLLEEAFSEGFLARQGIFDPKALGALRREFEERPPSPARDGKIWQIVCFQTWWHLHFR